MRGAKWANSNSKARRSRLCAMSTMRSLSRAAGGESVCVMGFGPKSRWRMAATPLPDLEGLDLGRGSGCDAYAIITGNTCARAPWITALSYPPERAGRNYLCATAKREFRGGMLAGIAPPRKTLRSARSFSTRPWAGGFHLIHKPPDPVSVARGRTGRTRCHPLRALRRDGRRFRRGRHRHRRHVRGLAARAQSSRDGL